MISDFYKSNKITPWNYIGIKSPRFSFFVRKRENRQGFATPMEPEGHQNKLTRGSTSHSSQQYHRQDKFLKDVPFRLLKGTIIVLFDAV